MLIRLGYDIQFNIPFEVPIVAMLSVHPSRTQDLLEPDELQTDPLLPVTTYIDVFGNRCSRFVAPAGRVRLSSSSLIHDSGKPDPINLSARQIPVGDLPNEVLSYLLNSRYLLDSSLSIKAHLENQYVPLGIGAVVVLQLLFTYTPPLQRVFDNEAIPVRVWPWVLLGGLIFFLVVEVEKLIIRSSATLRSAVSAVEAGT